jgi:hypothetical protein
MPDAVSSGSHTGFLGLNKEANPFVGAFGTFMTGGAGWAGSSQHYYIAVSLGIVAALVFAMAFCVGYESKPRFKWAVLLGTVLACGVLGSIAFRMANDQMHQAQEQAEAAKRSAEAARTPAPQPQPAPAPTPAPARAASSGTNSPAIAGSSGITINYGPQTEKPRHSAKER